MIIIYLKFIKILFKGEDLIITYVYSLKALSKKEAPISSLKQNKA